MSTDQQRKTSADLFPNGRRYFYEGDRAAEFIKAMRAYGLEPEVSVHVPSQLLDEIRANWPVGT
jgi:hypothetical protein